MPRSPLIWFGGKGKLAPRLLPLLPEHGCYVEPFGGAASLLFAKPRVGVEVYNDLHGDLVNFFRVFRDHTKAAELHRLLELTPYSREEHDLCVATYTDPELGELERARRFLVAVRQSFGGTITGGWGYRLTRSSTSGWANLLREWPAMARRFASVQVEHGDWRTVASRFDRPDALHYLDPPYDPATRSGREYEHELTIEQHASIVDWLLNDLSGMAVLSGYASEAYAPLEAAGWQRIDLPTHCHITGTTQASKGAATERVECVWLSPTCQAAQPSLFTALPARDPATALERSGAVEGDAHAGGQQSTLDLEATA